MDAVAAAAKRNSVVLNNRKWMQQQAWPRPIVCAVQKRMQQQASEIDHSFVRERCSSKRLLLDKKYAAAKYRRCL